ncbi:MAG: choice-of-anchor B family protein [Flavobacteriales bacterium]
MRQQLLFFVLLGTFLSLSAQNQPLNVSFKASFPYSDITQSQRLNDIWGYVDTSTGREYALVGLTTGFSIVDVSSSTLTEKARISGPYSTWRDIKTWGNHAFVVHDSWLAGSSQGLLVVDLSDIANGNAPFYSFTMNDSLERAHNIYIDEQGVAYLTGTNIGVGGALMLDVTNPNDIEVLGNYNDFYLHDCVTRGDTIWGGAIYQGFLVSVDVSDKSNPVELGQVSTPNLFTHNCWFSDDNQYVFTTDELTDSYVASYDVSDVANMQFLDQIQSYYSDQTIPHNTHYLDGYLVNSYYTDGLQIVDAQYPDNLIDVGHFDTSPQFEGDGYNGAWGAYPYLPSGKVLVSDMEEGLVVFDVNYTRAAYLHLNVIDAITGAAIPNANITFDNISEASNLEGKLKTGTPTGGIYDITCSKSGYLNFSDTVTVSNDVIVERTIVLHPGIGLEEFDETFSVETYKNSPEVHIHFPKEAFGEHVQILISGIHGQLIEQVDIQDLQTQTTSLTLPSTEGTYVVAVYQGAHLKYSTQLVKL